MNCLFCNKPLYRAKKYCCIKCQKEYQYISYIARWKEGKESGNIGSHGAISAHVRRYMFEKYDNKCSCGWNEINPYTKRIPLQVNHIDGKSDNTVEENLELLCPNCHSLTPTYGKLNNGNGRKQRYAGVTQG